MLAAGKVTGRESLEQAFRFDSGAVGQREDDGVRATARDLGRIAGTTEHRAGTYVFNDRMMVAAGAAILFTERETATAFNNLFVVDRFGTIWEARERSYEDPIRVSATSGTDVNWLR